MTESMFLDAISPDLRGSAQDRERFAIDGREPQEVACPESVEQVAEVLRVACERHLAVAPVGHGAFLHLGGSPRRYDLALSLQRLDRIVDYQPADMTVTVEAGMTLTRLQEVLGEHGQWLPIDPPVPEQVTIGGLIAANLSGVLWAYLALKPAGNAGLPMLSATVGVAALIMVLQAKIPLLSFIPGAFLGAATAVSVVVGANGSWTKTIIALVAGAVLGYISEVVAGR